MERAKDAPLCIRNTFLLLIYSFHLPLLSSFLSTMLCFSHFSPNILLKFFLDKQFPCILWLTKNKFYLVERSKYVSFWFWHRMLKKTWTEIPLHHFLQRRRQFAVCILLRLFLFWSELILACEAPNVVCVFTKEEMLKHISCLSAFALVSYELSKLYCAGFLFNNRNYSSMD